MKQTRRGFLESVVGGIGGAALTVRATADTVKQPSASGETEDSFGSTENAPEVDFRYSPATWQTAICFPDDPHKTLVGERGEFRYGYNRYKHVYFYPLIIEFTLGGMGRDELLSQRLEGPGIPIIHTRLRRHGALINLVTFASNLPGEGRVDNVIMDVLPEDRRTSLEFFPTVIVRTNRETRGKNVDGSGSVHWDSPEGPLFFTATRPLWGSLDQRRHGIERLGNDTLIEFGIATASSDQPVRVLYRFPQEGQDASRIKNGASDPAKLLDQVRAYWKSWQSFRGNVAWSIPGPSGAFLTACARNIQQAREVRDGKLTFQVGAANYRGLWIVDGHFILEAAQYLGYHDEARQGLETTWASQRADGGIFAGGGGEHWKDTAIAMFTLVRQAELSQDWNYFLKMRPQVDCALDFLISLRELAKEQGSASGKYGLVARGFGDGGMWGVRDEFTNTLWILAGLKSVKDAAETIGIPDEFQRLNKFYEELSDAFRAAAQAEMRRHSKGFDYLPMLMKSDKQWEDADKWSRPRPQEGQWALSHAICPGAFFDPADPIVQGHIKLMQDCTREDIPAETGWVEYGGVWNYNACFVAQVYLWAGLPDWARRTFIGFLNHAAPTYCWREEQPFQGSLTGTFVGDMPHNWASAECIRYLRHMLALEDGKSLRLLAGITTADLQAESPYELVEAPTRFGRVSLCLEPASSRGQRLLFMRANGPSPAAVIMPEQLGSRRLSGVSGATYKIRDGFASVDSASLNWTAEWT